MTPRDLAYEALSYIAPSGAPSNQATLTLASTRQKARIAADLTATMQEIYSAAPSLYRRTLSATLAGPTDINLTVTNGSQVVTTAATFTEGATIFVGGIFNQIYTDGADKKLLTPYGGTSGTVSATLYQDCIALDSTVSQVLDQVFIVGGRRLHPQGNRSGLMSGARPFRDYGRRLSITSTTPTTGEPQWYWVEDFMLAGTNHSSQRRLRFMPLSPGQLQVTYDAKLRAPTFAAADLGTDDIDSTRTFVVADNYHELLIRPIFLQKWAGSPWFRDTDARRWIDESATQARGELSRFSSQQKRNRRIIAPI